MAHYIASADQNQRATATREPETGWVLVSVADVGPNPGLNLTSLVEVRDGGRTIRLCPALATAIGDAANGV